MHPFTIYGGLDAYHEIHEILHTTEISMCVLPLLVFYNKCNHLNLLTVLLENIFRFYFI